jgi:hypothetical protein
VEERLVASIGIRGGYSKESFEENSKKLIDWLRVRLIRLTSHEIQSFVAKLGG